MYAGDSSAVVVVVVVLVEGTSDITYGYIFNLYQRLFVFPSIQTIIIRTVVR